MLMKKLLSLALCTVMAVSGCTSQGGIAGDPTAVMLGANIGGLTGAVIGSSGSYYHSYRGSLVGSLVGTIAGAAIASAATAPKKPAEDVYIVETRPYRERGYYDSYDGSRSSGRMPAYGRYRDGERSTDLEIRNIRFIDGNRNHIIESGEEAKIIFEVVNSGRLAAYHVTPVVAEKNGLKHLYISSSVTMECIPAGDGIRYTAVIRAGKMRRGEAVFHITALDGNGGMIPIREFTVPVRK